MRSCEGCGIEFKPRNSRHRFHSAECRKKSKQAPPHGPQRVALERQIEAMATGPEHAALVETCRGLASIVDYYTGLGGFDDKAWREYRLALTNLVNGATTDGGSDEFESIINQLRAEMDDTADSVKANHRA